MKSLITICFLFFPFLVIAQLDDRVESTWRVSGTSKVLVEGTSNVNEFKCVTLNYEGRDELRKYVQMENGMRSLTGSVEMKVRSFDCESRMMTNDLRETLKEHTYPTITIELLSLQIPQKSNGPERVRGKAKVTIAGTTQLLDMTWTVFANEAEILRLHGTHDFTFTQFNIDPPTKMMGMIRVKDEISVDFDLVMELIYRNEYAD